MRNEDVDYKTSGKSLNHLFRSKIFLSKKFREDKIHLYSSKHCFSYLIKNIYFMQKIYFLRNPNSNLYLYFDV